MEDEGFHLIHETTYQSSTGKQYVIKVSDRHWYLSLSEDNGSTDRWINTYTISKGVVDWDLEPSDAGLKDFAERYVMRLWRIRLFL